MVPPPPYQTKRRRGATGLEADRPAKGLSDGAQGCPPNLAGPSPRLTGFLGIFDLHGVGPRGEGRPPIRSTESRGGDSGGGWAARRGAAGSSPQAGRGRPRAGRRRLRRCRAQGAAPHPREGWPGPSKLGKAAGLAAPGPPRSRSKQKAPVAGAAATAAAAALRNSPPRPNAHVTRAPPSLRFRPAAGDCSSPGREAPLSGCSCAGGLQSPRCIAAPPPRPLSFRRSPQSGPSEKRAGS